MGGSAAGPARILRSTSTRRMAARGRRSAEASSSVGSTGRHRHSSAAGCRWASARLMFSARRRPVRVVRDPCSSRGSVAVFLNPSLPAKTTLGRLRRVRYRCRSRRERAPTAKRADSVGGGVGGEAGEAMSSASARWCRKGGRDVQPGNRGPTIGYMANHLGDRGRARLRSDHPRQCRRLHGGDRQRVARVEGRRHLRPGSCSTRASGWSRFLLFPAYELGARRRARAGTLARASIAGRKEQIKQRRLHQRATVEPRHASVRHLARRRPGRGRSQYCARARVNGISADRRAARSSSLRPPHRQCRRRIVRPGWVGQPPPSASPR